MTTMVERWLSLGPLAIVLFWGSVAAWTVVDWLQHPDYDFADNCNLVVEVRPDAIIEFNTPGGGRLTARLADVGGGCYRQYGRRARYWIEHSVGRCAMVWKLPDKSVRVLIKHPDEVVSNDIWASAKRVFNLGQQLREAQAAVRCPPISEPDESIAPADAASMVWSKGATWATSLLPEWAPVIVSSTVSSVQSSASNPRRPLRVTSGSGRCDLRLPGNTGMDETMVKAARLQASL